MIKSQLAAKTEAGVIIVSSDRLPIETRASVVPVDYIQLDGWLNIKEQPVGITLATLICEIQHYPMEAFREAIAAKAEFSEDNLAVIEAAG